MHWVDYPYANPFTVEMKGPDGKPIDVKTSINTPRKPPIQKRNFIAAEPGRIRTMGYGFQLGHVQQPGPYTVTLRYKNAEDGKTLGIANAWTGEAATPEVKIVVPK